MASRRILPGSRPARRSEAAWRALAPIRDHSLRALGYPVGLDEVVLVNISVALLAGLVPIPGGIGVAEGGLTFGLVQAGVTEEVAFAAVLLYRMWTFYLPPIWGFFALRWLERNKHL